MVCATMFKVSALPTYASTRRARYQAVKHARTLQMIQLQLRGRALNLREIEPHPSP